MDFLNNEKLEGVDVCCEKQVKVERKGRETVEERAKVGEEMVVATEPEIATVLNHFCQFGPFITINHKQSSFMRVVKLVPSRTAFLLCDLQSKFRALFSRRFCRWLNPIFYQNQPFTDSIPSLPQRISSLK